MSFFFSKDHPLNKNVSNLKDVSNNLDELAN